MKPHVIVLLCSDTEPRPVWGWREGPDEGMVWLLSLVFLDGHSGPEEELLSAQSPWGGTWARNASLVSGFSTCLSFARELLCDRDR